MLSQKDVEKLIDNLINHITDTEEIDVALGHIFKDLEANRASCLPQLVSYTWQKFAPEQNILALIHFLKQISSCPQPNTMARYFEVIDYLIKSQTCSTKTVVDALLKSDCLHIHKPLFMECAYQVIISVLHKLDYKTNREVLSKSLELSLVLPVKLNSNLSRRLAAYVKVMTHLLSHDGQFMPVYFTMYELNKLFTRDKCPAFSVGALGTSQFSANSTDRRIHPLFSRQIKLMFDAFWAPAVLFSVPFHFHLTAIPGVTSLGNYHFRLDATTLLYNFQGAMPAPEHLLGMKIDVTMRLGCLPRSSDLLEVYVYNPNYGKEFGRHTGVAKTLVNLVVQAARFVETTHGIIAAAALSPSDAQQKILLLHYWARDFFDHLQCLAFRLINYRIFVRANDFIMGLSKLVSERSGKWTHSWGYICWFIFNMVSAFLPHNKLSDFVTCVEVLDHVYPLHKLPLSLEKRSSPPQEDDLDVKLEPDSSPPNKKCRTSPQQPTSDSATTTTATTTTTTTDSDSLAQNMHNFINKIEQTNWSDGRLLLEEEKDENVNNDLWNETRLFSIAGIWMLLIDKNPTNDLSSSSSNDPYHGGNNLSEYLPRPMPPLIARIHQAVDKHLHRVINLCHIVLPTNEVNVNGTEGPSELMKKVADCENAQAKLEVLFAPRGVPLKRIILLINSISSTVDKLTTITQALTHLLWNGITSHNQELHNLWKCGFQMDHNLSGPGIEEPLGLSTLNLATLHLKMQLQLALLNKFNRSQNMVPPPGVVETVARLLCQFEAEEKLLHKLENFLVPDKICNYMSPGTTPETNLQVNFTIKDPVALHTMVDILAFRVSHLLSPLRKMQCLKLLYAFHRKTLFTGSICGNPSRMQIYSFIDSALIKLLSRLVTPDDLHHGWLNNNITVSMSSCTTTLPTQAMPAGALPGGGGGGGAAGTGGQSASGGPGPGTIGPTLTAQCLITDSPELNRFALLQIGHMFLTYDLDELPNSCKWLQDLMKSIIRKTPSACIMSESTLNLLPRALHDEIQTHTKSFSQVKTNSPSNSMEGGDPSSNVPPTVNPNISSPLLFLNLAVRQNNINYLHELFARWSSLENNMDSSRLLHDMAIRKMFFCILWKHFADKNGFNPACISFLEQLPKTLYDDQLRLLCEYIVAVLITKENAANFLPQLSNKIYQFIENFHLFSLDRFILFIMSLPLSDERHVNLSHVLIISLLSSYDKLNQASAVLAEYNFLMGEVFPDNWHEILCKLQRVWPDHSPIHKLWLLQEGSSSGKMSGNFHSSTCRYLPVYYAHIAQRLLPIIEQFHMRLLAHKTLHEQLPQFVNSTSFLFRFHGSPLSYVYNLLKFNPINSNLNMMKRYLVLPIIRLRLDDTFMELKPLLLSENSLSTMAMSKQFYYNILTSIVKSNRSNVITCRDPTALVNEPLCPASAAATDNGNGEENNSAAFASSWPNMFDFHANINKWRSWSMCNRTCEQAYLAAVQLMLCLTYDVDVNQIVNGLYDAVLQLPVETMAESKTSNVIDYTNALALLLSVCPAVIHQGVYRRFHYLLSDECLHACLPRENLVENLVSHIVPNLCPREHRWSREIMIWHAYWVHVNSASLAHIKDVVMNYFVNQVNDEAKFILVLSLIGPHSLRLNKEATTIHTDLTGLLYQMLVQVDGLSRLLFMDVIVDCLYHLKYMYVGNGPFHKIRELIPKLRPALQEKLKFMIPRP